MSSSQENCPPGLEFLSTTDSLLVKQVLESAVRFRLVSPYAKCNMYTIQDSDGDKIFSAFEESSCCSRSCCGYRRSFVMYIKNNEDEEVIQLNRPLACDNCLCPCWLQSMEVACPPGTVIGTVKQEWSFGKTNYKVKNAAGDVLLRIKGPSCCKFWCCTDIDFQVYSKNDITIVGKITRQYPGPVGPRLNPEIFNMNFPMDMDVKIKALLLGACFLIDFMFFEDYEEKTPIPISSRRRRRRKNCLLM